MPKGMSLLLVVAMAIAVGCEPEKKAGWLNPLDDLEVKLPKDTNDIEYSLARMHFGMVGINLGCYSRAKPILKEAFDQFDVDKSGAAAAVSSERYKFYKGESFERAAVCWQLGFLEYLAGDWNTARIYFSKAITEDRRAIIKKETPEIIGDDFALTYFWLGRAYMKLGDEDNARIAFSKSDVITPRPEDVVKQENEKDKREATDLAKMRAEGEEWIYKRFSNPKEKDLFIPDIINLATVKGTFDNPTDWLAATKIPTTQPTTEPTSNPTSLTNEKKTGDDSVLTFAKDRKEFFSIEFQKQTNLAITIAYGASPYKYLGGLQNEHAYFGKSVIRPKYVRVYIDDRPAGEAFELLDLWTQATTQDRNSEKDAAQASKALTKTAMNFFGFGDNWDVTGDTRYWANLPGRYDVYSAKVAPGVHTIRLEFYDFNKNLLPRWTNTYEGIQTPASGDRALLVHPKFDGDNAISPEMAKRAIKGGANGLEK